MNSITVPKNVIGDIHFVAKYRNKRRGDALVESKKVQKKSRIVPKKIRVKNTKGSPMCLRFWTSIFFFGRGSGVSSMFWTSVVGVDDVEQMNKKVDRSRWTDEKKTSNCRGRAFSSKTPTKNIPQAQSVCPMFGTSLLDKV